MQNRLPTENRIVVDFYSASFRPMWSTGLNLVDATEMRARPRVQAFEKGRSGERVRLGGENLTLKQILDRTLLSITGLPSPTVKLPYIIRACRRAVSRRNCNRRILGKEPRSDD